MASLLKTVFIVGFFLAQLSSSAVVPRHGGRHYHSHASHSGVPTALTSSIELPVATTSRVPASITMEPLTPTRTAVISSDSGSDDSSEDEPTYSLTTLGTTSVIVPAATSQAAASASITAIASATQAAGTFWQPAAGSTWQIELSGVVSDLTYAADVFDLDLFDVPQATVDALHAAGKKVICYFSAGSFENWRSDAADFQEADKGSAMEGWDGEWWLDTRTANVRSIMTTRIALAKSKGCDGVDPDNVDGYANSNGVGLTAADGVDYLDFLADAAHAQGLSIGLKNAGDLVDSVLANMQWHVNEQCLEFDECDLFKPFIDAGKPVFHIEYPETAPTISADIKSEKCVAATSSGFSTVLKTESLDAWVEAC